MKDMMDPTKMPFDTKRMFWGGFKSLVELGDPVFDVVYRAIFGALSALSIGASIIRQTATRREAHPR